MRAVGYARRAGRARTAALLCVLAVVFAPADARAVRFARLDACALVRPTDATRLLGWTVDGHHETRYDLRGDTGTMCVLDATLGEIIVTVADPSTGFPGVNAFNDENARGLAQTVRGLGADVVLYNGTAYVSKRHRNVSVRVVPNDHAASYDDVRGFARVVVPRIR